MYASSLLVRPSGGLPMSAHHSGQPKDGLLFRVAALGARGWLRPARATSPTAFVPQVVRPMAHATAETCGGPACCQKETSNG